MLLYYSLTIKRKKPVKLAFLVAEAGLEPATLGY